MKTKSDMASFKENGKLKLLIIVGTRPEIIRLAAQQDYEGFYQRELEMRRLQNAPPFYDWIAFSASGTDESAVVQALRRCRWMLENSFESEADIHILGPIPLPVVKINDKYRYRLQICCHISVKIRNTLATILEVCAKDKELNRINFYVENDV